MKVAIVAESFLPQTNGVVHSVLRTLEHLAERGIEATVIAPDAPPGHAQPTTVAGAAVVPLVSWSFPGYEDVRVAGGRVEPVERILGEFQPDVVHLASPYVLGWRGVRAANTLGIPSVAVYQTDVPSFAVRYGFPWAHKLLSTRVRDIHSAATLTLAPSTASIDVLAGLGVQRVRLWRRGVDTGRFDPALRDEALRLRLAPEGEKLVGFVGRLAREKQVQDLASLTDVPGTRLVVVGDGPERRRLERLLPDARMTGMLHGDELAATMASLDVLVHTGESETFCQVVQEALASGVPVVAVRAGGPIDLVDHSRTGWLYPPGDLAAMADHVRDLTGDESKRQAFGRAARASVAGRTWRSICTELIGHYSSAIEAYGGLRPEDLLPKKRRRALR
ncbi:MAG TPA: glycosyltransferase family 1 protein [Aeromicrobium sp.]|nr:glycosyltransferase family 1 protein [Aeromicrobium sp.]